MAVYGNLLSAFPELMRTITVWTRDDKSDQRLIRGVYMPTRGDRLKNQKYTSRGQAVQYFEDDCLFVGRSFRDRVAEGDYFYSPQDARVCRIVGKADWQFEGGFTRFITERVTGANVDQQDDLEVKGARFA